jgi:hypothetical protein
VNFESFLVDKGERLTGNRWESGFRLESLCGRRLA